MKKKIYIVLPIICALLYITLSSSSGGITGVSVSGCSCHGVASSNTLVSITGLPSGGYINGGIYSITISVTNNVIVASTLGLRDGFDMTATAGTFTAVAGTSSTVATEIRHNTPKAVTAGTASWTFNWTAPSTGNSNITFNAAGNATNGSGNTTGDSWNLTSVTIIKSGQALAVTPGINPITCNGGTATISSTGVGGVPPYTYQKNALGYQASNMFTANAAGTYTITIKDATAATATTVATLTQPTAIVPSASNTAIACNAGTTTITASGTGGTGIFNYKLNAGSFVTTNAFTSQLAGTYTITVRDANLCTNSTTLVVTQPNALSFTVPAITTPLCNGGVGLVSTVGMNGTGSKTYSITPLGPQSNTTGNFIGLTAQLYTITTTDANACTKTTVVNMTQPSLIIFNSAIVTNPTCAGTLGSVVANATGGTGAITYTIAPLGPQSNTTGTFSSLTAQAYTITAKDANNCTKTSVITVTVPVCNSILNLKLYLEGFYTSSGAMSPTLMNQGVSGATTTDVDDVMVKIYSGASPSTLVTSATARLKTNGLAVCTLSPLSGNYYVAIEHRNSVKTYSANPIAIASTPINYDFSNAANKAYGSNLLEIEPGIFAIYTGDLNQDGIVDNSDFSIWETDANNFTSGFVITDFNGDGIVDNTDYSLWEADASNFVGVVGP
jgi:hypothetical protein